MRVSGIFVVLLNAGVALAQAQQSEPVSFCSAYAEVHLPLNDRPTTAQAKGEFSGCSALDWYYRASPRHFEKARLCAFSDMGVVREDPSSEDAILEGEFSAGTAFTLAALYANGEGVKANPDIARHFACQSQDWDNSPDVVAASIQPGKHFEPCLRSGSVSGRQTNLQCVGIRDMENGRKLKDVDHRLEASLPTATLGALQRLRTTRLAYLKAHATEQHPGTSGAVQSEWSEELEEKQQWLDLMQAVASRTLPTDVLQSRPLAEADKELNTAYRSDLQFSKTSCPTGKFEKTDVGCTSPGQRRLVERIWLPYRDAWVAFGKLVWPDVPEDHWRSWMTQKRLVDMAEID